jgi:hypothetical protein
MLPANTQDASVSADPDASAAPAPNCAAPPRSSLARSVTVAPVASRKLPPLLLAPLFCSIKAWPLSVPVCT